MDFAELRSHRRDLRTFCANHLPTIEAFKTGSSYRRELTATPEPPAEGLRHLTSTATCLESLGEVAEPPPDLALADRWLKFGKAALDRQTRWTSDGSAEIYCRCRALPLVLRGVPEYDEELGAHLKVILTQLDQEDGRFGIGEANPETPPETWYPPNAFHTYWTLEILGLLGRFRDCPLLPENDRAMRRKRDAMLLWTQQVLGSQIALHNARSSARDTDQLVWALAGVLGGTPEWTPSLQKLTAEVGSGGLFEGGPVMQQLILDSLSCAHR